MSNLFAHIEHLCNQFNVTIAIIPWLPPWDARSYPERRTVVCAPITDDVTYMIALHEMGHIVAKGGADPEARRVTGLNQILRKVDEENAAWRWAREQALTWTADMEDVSRWAFDTYRASLYAQLDSYRMKKSIKDLFKQ